MATQKIITSMAIGTVNGNVAWVFQYQDGSRQACGCGVTQESFSLHPAWARQFLQGLQEQLLALEASPAPPLEGTRDGLWMGDSANVRLQEPTEGD